MLQVLKWHTLTAKLHYGSQVCSHLAEDITACGRLWENTRWATSTTADGAVGHLLVIYERACYNRYGLIPHKVSIVKMKVK